MTRYDVLMTGVGGKGVLSAGLLLAQAGMNQYQNVLWFPSYQAAMRGGPSECTVVLSQEEIPSPILSSAQAVVVMEPSQFKDFQTRVISGGLLLAEEAGLPRELARKDVKLVTVPAVGMGLKLGDTQVSNYVLLGAYIQLTRAITLELAVKEIEKRFAGREKTQKLNITALKQGAEAVA